MRYPHPRAGWFPDEDDPRRRADDPPDEPPLVTVDSPMEERLALLDAVLASVDATVR